MHRCFVYMLRCIDVTQSRCSRLFIAMGLWTYLRELFRKAPYDICLYAVFAWDRHSGD